MAIQVGSLSKSSSAGITLEWPFSSVYPLMALRGFSNVFKPESIKFFKTLYYLQLLKRDEEFPANFTGYIPLSKTKFLSEMDLGMFRQC